VRVIVTESRTRCPSFAIGHAKFCSRSHDGVIRVYDDAGNVIASAVNSPGADSVQRL